MQVFTSEKKAEQYINTNPVCPYYLYHNSKYRVFNTIELLNEYKAKHNL